MSRFYEERLYEEIRALERRVSIYRPVLEAIADLDGHDAESDFWYAKDRAETALKEANEPATV